MVETREPSDDGQNQNKCLSKIWYEDTKKTQSGDLRVCSEPVSTNKDICVQITIGAIADTSYSEASWVKGNWLLHIEWSDAFEVGCFLHSWVKKDYYVVISRLCALWARLLLKGLTHPHGNKVVYVFILLAWDRTLVRVRRCSHLQVQGTFKIRWKGNLKKCLFQEEKLR